MLVAVQIRQDDGIAKANLQADSFVQAANHYSQLAEEDAAASLAKAIADNNQLDDRDMVILHSLYTAEYVKTVRQEMMFDGPIMAEAAAARWSGSMLNNPY